jgi:hypothetical protein
MPVPFDPFAVRPSLRAKRSNPEPLLRLWIASSLTLLAMTMYQRPVFTIVQSRVMNFCSGWFGVVTVKRRRMVASFG